MRRAKNLSPVSSTQFNSLAIGMPKLNKYIKITNNDAMERISCFILLSININIIRLSIDMNPISCSQTVPVYAEIPKINPVQSTNSMSMYSAKLFLTVIISPKIIRMDY